MLYWKIVMWQFSLHDYFSKTIILSFSNWKSWACTIFTVTLHASYIWNIKITLGFILEVQFLGVTTDSAYYSWHFPPITNIVLPLHIFSGLRGYYSKVTFRVMETNKFCLNSWLCLKNYNNFGIGLTPNSAIDFSIACKRQLQ